MPVLLALAAALFLAGAPWPDPAIPRDPGLAAAAARSFAAHHEAARGIVAARPDAAGPVDVALPHLNGWRQRSCSAGGSVATATVAGAGPAAALLPPLRRLLGDPPGLGIADGGDTVLAGDHRRHDLPCSIPAGAVVLVGRI